jgi:hypothetical protein
MRHIVFGLHASDGILGCVVPQLVRRKCVSRKCVSSPRFESPRPSHVATGATTGPTYRTMIMITQGSYSVTVTVHSVPGLSDTQAVPRASAGGRPGAPSGPLQWQPPKSLAGVTARVPGVMVPQYH